MKHEVDVEQCGPMGPAMAEAIQTCVHCGFCLPGCPTYQELQQEQDSPRGRILLMKEVLEGNLELEEALPHIDRCLGCVACETNCPSGVVYGELISPFRDYARTRRRLGGMERLKRWLVLQTLPYPGRFRWAMRMAQWTRWLQPLTPATLRPMLDMVPDALPAPERLRPFYPAVGERRAKVALLAGCAQQVLSPEINRATISVLNHNGVEVVVPETQGCCGALAWHVGESDRARQAARRNLKAFPVDDCDAIVTNAAGCGSGIHEYPLLFRGEAEQAAAERFASHTMDVSVFLDQLGLREVPAGQRPRRVAYHDACHLVHAQKVRVPPRRMLLNIPGLELVAIQDSEICCGSAGTYNIDQPEVAEKLGRRKADAIRATGCDVVTAGNIGCLVQIERYLSEATPAIPVVHPMVLLDDAYRQVDRGR